MTNTTHISNLEEIEFEFISYKIRTVHIKGCGDCTIGTESLKNALFDEKNELYVSTEARNIDEAIFFFVEDKYINLSDIKLANFVCKQLA